MLSDPELRRRYDASGRTSGRCPDDSDPDAWRRARAYAGAGAGAARRGLVVGGGRRSGGFGGRRLRRRRRHRGPARRHLRRPGGPVGAAGWGPIPGADQEAELELTVEEAYRGGRRTITLTGPDGPRTLDVTIPAGVTDGQRIRLAGQGGRGSGGGAAGDLYLRRADRAPPALPASRAATSTSTCRSPRGRRRSARRSPSTRPGGEAKVGAAGHVERPAAAAARAAGMPNPTRQARGPVRRGRRSWCRRRLDRRGARGCSRSSRTVVRPSTRGGSSDDRGHALALAPARPARPRRASPGPPALHPDWCAAWSPSACSSRPRRRGASCGSPRPSSPPLARIQRLRAGLALNYAALGLVLDLLDRIARAARAAPARATLATTGGRTVDMNRLTQKSQEALHDAQTKALRFGHTEVDGEHLLLALLDQPDGLVAPAAGAGGRRPGPAARGAGGRAGAPPAGHRPGRRARAGVRHPAAVAGCSTPPSGRPSGSRTSTSRSSTCVLALVDEGARHRGRPAAARARGSPATRSWRR